MFIDLLQCWVGISVISYWVHKFVGINRWRYQFEVSDVCMSMQKLMDYSLTRGASPKESMVKYVEEFKSTRMIQSQQMVPNSRSRNSIPSVNAHPLIRVNGQGQESNVQQKAHNQYGIAASKNIAGLQLVTLGSPQRGNSAAYFQGLESSRNRPFFYTTPSARVILQPPTLTATQICQSHAHQMRRQHNNVGVSSSLEAAAYNIQNNQHPPDFQIPRIEDLILPQTYPGECSGIHGVGTLLSNNNNNDNNINYSGSQVVHEEISGVPANPIYPLENMMSVVGSSSGAKPIYPLENMTSVVGSSSGGMTPEMEALTETVDQNTGPREKDFDEAQLLRFLGMDVLEDNPDYFQIP